MYHHEHGIRQKAVNDTTRYIELEYNQTRIQKVLGMRAPRRYGSNTTVWSRDYNLPSSSVCIKQQVSITSFQ